MIKRIYAFFTETILQHDAGHYRNPLVRWSVQQYKLLFYTARGLIDHGTIVRSAALTFYTLMSLVPIAAVIFAIVKGFGLTDGLLDNLYAAFPQNPEIIDYLLDFADRALARTQGGVVAVVALVTLFWAVIRVFGSIESAFNNIWEVKVTRSLMRQYSTYITIVVVVPLLWVASRALVKYFEVRMGLDDTWLWWLLSKVLVLVLSWGIFALLYVTIPNTKVRLRSALTAGIVAGTLFLVFQWGYVYLQRWMTSYNAIYGSFAAVPLLLIWMQISWQILLFGGELSFAYQNIGKFSVERETLCISYDQRRKVMLAIMLVVVRRFHDGGGATETDELRRRLRLPTRLLNDVLYELSQADLLRAVADDDAEHDASYLPMRDIATLTVYGTLEAVEAYGQTPFDLSGVPEMQRVDEELEKLKQAARQGQDNLRLIDLI